MLGYLDVSTIHRTLTWTTGSLTCVCDLFAWAHTRGNSVHSLIRRTWRVCTEFDSGEIQGRRKAQHGTVTHPFWWPRSIVLNSGFRERVLCKESEYCAKRASTVQRERERVLCKESEYCAKRASTVQRERERVLCKESERVLCKESEYSCSVASDSPYHSGVSAC